MSHVKKLDREQIRFIIAEKAAEFVPKIAPKCANAQKRDLLFAEVIKLVPKHQYNQTQSLVDQFLGLA